jgi:hypothetical protein
MQLTFVRVMRAISILHGSLFKIPRRSKSNIQLSHQDSDQSLFLVSTMDQLSIAIDPLKALRSQAQGKLAPVVNFVLKHVPGSCPARSVTQDDTRHDHRSLFIDITK